MMRAIIFLFLFTNTLYGQFRERLVDNLHLDSIYKAENQIEKYNSFEYDFSNVWTETNNQFVYGIIGEEHQRLFIKFISVFRISNRPLSYNIYGKSRVNDKISEFFGNIEINEIREVKKMHYGVDDEFANSGMKAQGILIADYDFYQDKNQKGNGLLKGKLYSKWYLNLKNNIEYDKIEIFSDDFINNAYIGTWKSYSTGLEKKCNWGDYRVPEPNSDFDIGSGEISVSQKYWDKGWLDVVLKNKSPNGAIRPSKISKKNKKEWWK